ncbi:MAG TPA: GyrI-like domain-containing protein [Dehalococcoidia bacterium]|nr:GyrI-like domain-containing protein [Dehalococcoidia bacterium]
MVATYEVSLVELEGQNAAVIRETTTLANIGAALSEMLGAVAEYLREMKVTPSGPPFARYYAVDAKGVDVEAGYPTPTEVPRRWRVVPAELPGGSAAATWHTGPYDRIGDAYAALDEWLKANRRRRSGPPMEVYWTDPSQVDDPSQWRTQVIQPLAP